MTEQSKAKITSYIESIRGGDRQAFESLYRETLPVVRAVCGRYFSDRHEIEDAVQESYVKIYKSLPSLKEPEAFSAWSRAIAQNTCLNMIRSRNLMRGHEEMRPMVSEDEQVGMEDLTAEEYRKESIPEAVMESQWKASLVNDILSSLTDVQRSCILLWSEGYTYQAIAQRLAMPVGSAKSTVFYAKRKVVFAVEEIERTQNIRLHIAPIPFFLFLLSMPEGEEVISGAAAGTANTVSSLSGAAAAADTAFGAMEAGEADAAFGTMKAGAADAAFGAMEAGAADAAFGAMKAGAADAAFGAMKAGTANSAFGTAAAAAESSAAGAPVSGAAGFRSFAGAAAKQAAGKDAAGMYRRPLLSYAVAAALLFALLLPVAGTFAFPLGGRVKPMDDTITSEAVHAFHVSELTSGRKSSNEVETNGTGAKKRGGELAQAAEQASGEVAGSGSSGENKTAAAENAGLVMQFYSENARLTNENAGPLEDEQAAARDGIKSSEREIRTVRIGEMEENDQNSDAFMPPEGESERENGGDGRMSLVLRGSPDRLRRVDTENERSRQKENPGKQYGNEADDTKPADDDSRNRTSENTGAQDDISESGGDRNDTSGSGGDQSSTSGSSGDRNDASGSGEDQSSMPGNNGEQNDTSGNKGDESDAAGNTGDQRSAAGDSGDERSGRQNGTSGNAGNTGGSTDRGGDDQPGNGGSGNQDSSGESGMRDEEPQGGTEGESSETPAEENSTDTGGNSGQQETPADETPAPEPTDTPTPEPTSTPEMYVPIQNISIGSQFAYEPVIDYVLNTGDSYQIPRSVYPDNTTEGLVWSTSADGVTVDENGIVTNSGFAGVAQVTAQSELTGATANMIFTNVPVTSSGQCGDNVYWEISGNTLHFYGTGDMWPDYDASLMLYNPWLAYANDITSVQIDEGITSVEHSAFYALYRVSEIVIPDGVTKIGDWTFMWCRAEVIHLPNTLQYIADSAIWGVNTFYPEIIFHGTWEEWNAVDKSGRILSCPVTYAS